MQLAAGYVTPAKILAEQLLIWVNKVNIMKKLTKTRLAQELGISRVMLYRYIRKGCPTDSVNSVLQWKRNNLDIMQTKEWRIDDNPGVRR